MSNSLQKNDNGRHRNGHNHYDHLTTSSITNQNQGGAGLDPKVIVYTMLRYKWLILLFLISGGVGGWYYAESITPIYQSHGTMLINAGGNAGDNELSRIISQTTGEGVNASLANELQVLRSRSFAERVAERFMENVSGEPDEYPLLWRETEEEGFIPAGIDHVTNRIRSNLEFQLVNRESEVVQILFTSSSRRETATVINLAMDVYVETSTLQNRQAAEQTVEFLEQEKEELKMDLENAERQLKEYMDNTGIVRMNDQASGIVNTRNQIIAQIEEVELDLESVELAIEHQERELDRIRPGLQEDFTNAVAPRIRGYQDQLSEYERERYLILSRNPNVREREVTPPRLRFLDEEIENLKAEIAELSKEIFSEENEYMGMESAERTQMITGIQGRLVELRMQKSQMESRMEVLNERLNQADQNYQNLPEDIIQLAQLERDVEMTEQLYLNVSRQYSDMLTWKETQYGFGRIIDQATIPGYPISPNKIMLLVMFVILGGLASVVIIIVKEFFDNSISSVDQMRNHHLPILATIPSFKKMAANGENQLFSVGNGSIPKEMVILRDRSNIVSESIRRLKNNIIYQNDDKAPKTIAVTSPEKGDGKSTVVCNLAVAFAEEGYRTLLIDADFRRPKVHTYFGLSNAVGVSNYLNDGLSISEIINDSDLKNLKIITSGTKNDRPELISSSEPFKQLLKRLEDVFDVIIIDTPPYGIISDSTSLLRRVDMTVLVAKYRKTNQAVFVHTLEELGRINANVSGLVLNDFNPKKETSNLYGSSYYDSVYTDYSSYVDS
jgi:capsular exopolysaccharide synthesis family protein